VRDLGVDARQSVVVGGRWLDIAMAQQVGARGVLVRTGYGAVEEPRRPANLTADSVVNNLVEAVSWALVNIPPFPYADRPLRTPAAR
jgi:phosphoglycolate phosphatase-like HAD superfamily hydrolase